jgi:hypothetical protein
MRDVGEPEGVLAAVEFVPAVNDFVPSNAATVGIARNSGNKARPSGSSKE